MRHLRGQNEPQKLSALTGSVSAFSKMVNYISRYGICEPHRITDCSAIVPGDYMINVWADRSTCKLYSCYLQVVSRTKKFITITDKDTFVKLSWNEEDKYWGKNQGYQCRTYINENELPEGLETID